MPEEEGLLATLSRADTAVASWIEGALSQLATDLTPSFNAGLQDMHQTLVAFPDSMQPASVLGQAGFPTPGEVDRALHPEDMYGPSMSDAEVQAGYEQYLAETPPIRETDVDRMYDAYLAEQASRMPTVEPPERELELER